MSKNGSKTEGKKASKKKSVQSGVKKCGQCGAAGHNSRTCGRAR